MNVLKKIGKIVGNILWGIVLVLVGAIALFFACMVVLFFVLMGISLTNAMLGGEEERIHLYSFSIEAMKDNHTYVVSRYGSGDDGLKYYFVRNINGETIIGNTDVNDSAIVEDGQNKVEVYYQLPAVGTELYMKTMDLMNIEEDKYYVYHIPEGSVEREFNVDLE